MFGGLSLGVLYGYFTEGVMTKQDGPFSVALLEALAWPFIYFGESDVRPRPIQRGRIEGRERGNLPVTAFKPPVAQRAGGIRNDVTANKWPGKRDLIGFNSVKYLFFIGWASLESS